VAIETENAMYFPINFVIIELGVVLSQESDIIIGKGHFGKSIIERIKFEKKGRMWSPNIVWPT
jgi:hypothetical protein